MTETTGDRNRDRTTAASVLHVEDVDVMYGRLEAAKPYVPKVPRPFRNDVLDAIDEAQQALLRLVTELIEHG